MVRQRVPFGEAAFADVVLWKFPVPIPGCVHLFKYRLAFVLAGECVLRYDNVSGKGDHRHLFGQATSFSFDSPEQLIQDFLSEARRIYREDCGS